MIREMRAPEIVTELVGFRSRGAGSDAERRSGGWLARQIESGGRRVRVEPFWCRPNWALAHAWHVVLALAGSLVCVSSPRIGGALLAAALVSIVADEFTGFSPGRRLSPERASQNVIGLAPESDPPKRVRLIVTANYDAPRTGIAYRARLSRPVARLSQLARGVTPGWLGWLCLAVIGLIAIAVLRLEGNRGTLVGVLQLIPTVGLVLALAMLLEIGTSNFSPGAADNASGAAVAIALASALDAAAPGHLGVELLLQGAGGQGMRHYLRLRRKQLTAPNTIVLGIAPCGQGDLRWWMSDGPLVPMRYLARLRTLCAAVSASQPHLHADAKRGRGHTPALQARAARLPAIALGSSRTADEKKPVEPQTLDATLQFALMLVDEIDAYLAEQARKPASQPDLPAAPVTPA
jgi:hypothetical protein